MDYQGCTSSNLSPQFSFLRAATQEFVIQIQIGYINDLMLLTAKPVIYLANLSERDYIRKKNKWLPKIKQWIDENNPGDLLIPFSVALEERMLQEFEDDKVRVEEFTKLSTQGQLGRIMVAGYQALNVRLSCSPTLSLYLSHSMAKLTSHHSSLAHPILHLRSSRSTSLDNPRRYKGTSSGGSDSH